MRIEAVTIGNQRCTKVYCSQLYTKAKTPETTTGNLGVCHGCDDVGNAELRVLGFRV